MATPTDASAISLGLHPQWTQLHYAAASIDEDVWPLVRHTVIYLVAACALSVVITPQARRPPALPVGWVL
ncbi:hypothetical protein FHR55_002319 [Xanthomonas arboricola]